MPSDSSGSAPSTADLPIGNLTSQFLANLHLNALDHCLSALPGVRAYLRYVDDLALFADHPEPLQRARGRLDAELAALRLRAHPVKTQIRRCREGASFVGFVVRSGRLRVRNHNLRRGRRRLMLQHSAVLAGTPIWPMATTGACGAACLRAWTTRPTYPENGRVAQLAPAAAPGTTTPGTAARPTATTTSPTTPTTTSVSVWSASPSTLHRQSRWKGFQREIRKGPDPLP